MPQASGASPEQSGANPKPHHLQMVMSRTLGGSCSVWQECDIFRMSLMTNAGHFPGTPQVDREEPDGMNSFIKG